MRREEIKNLIYQAEMRTKNHLLGVMMERMQHIEESFRLQIKEAMDFFQELMESVNLDDVMNEVVREESVDGSPEREVMRGKMRRSWSRSSEREVKRPRLHGIDDRESPRNRERLQFPKSFSSENLYSKGDSGSEHTKLLLQKKLTEIRFNPRKERVSEFLEKFDGMVSKIRRHGSFNDDEVKVCLFLTIGKHFPLVHEMFKLAKPQELSLAEIKARLYEEEEKIELGVDEEEKDDARDVYMESRAYSHPRPMRSPPSRNPATMKCYKCSQFGHFKQDCRVKGWKCYVCQQITDHRAPDCPYNQAPSASKATPYKKRLETERRMDTRKPPRRPK